MVKKWEESVYPISYHAIKFMQELTVSLNVHEIGIIMSSLKNLENIDEIHLAREYGSVMALRDKLNSIWEEMDKTETGLRYDVVPSF
jgi:hypothetical protein